MKKKRKKRDYVVEVEGDLVPLRFFSIACVSYTIERIPVGIEDVITGKKTNALREENRNYDAIFFGDPGINKKKGWIQETIEVIIKLFEKTDYTYKGKHVFINPSNIKTIKDNKIYDVFGNVLRVKKVKENKDVQKNR